MQTIQPDQADFLLHGVYLPSLRNEQGLTRKVIEAIPLEQGGYRPDEVSKSALDLAWHIAATEIRFMDAVAAGAFDFSPRPLPDSIRNSKDLAAWYSENFEPRFETLTKLSKEQLTKVVDFRGLFQLPAVMYLNFVLHHSIHHRGQLSTYLRPMGAKVPAIYGESYDSAAARKAASRRWHRRQPLADGESRKNGGWAPKSFVGSKRADRVNADRAAGRGVRSGDGGQKHHDDSRRVGRPIIGLDDFHFVSENWSDGQRESDADCGAYSGEAGGLAENHADHGPRRGA